MGATDDAFGLLMARARAREKAMLEAMEIHKTGEHVDITPELQESMKQVLLQLLDEEITSTMSDPILNHQVESDATTINGLSKNLEALLNDLDAGRSSCSRTGINTEFDYICSVELLVKAARYSC